MSFASVYFSPFFYQIVYFLNRTFIGTVMYIEKALLNNRLHKYFEFQLYIILQ